MEQATPRDMIGAGLISNRGFIEGSRPRGTYVVECIGKDGQVKWRDTIENLWTTVGKNLVLDTLLSGSGYTASVALGLVSATPTVNAADTMATHAGWSEVGGSNAPAYSGNRKSPTFNAAASGSKALTAAQSFSITSSGTVGGVFIVLAGSTSKDNTTGTLFSVGAFSGGNKSVDNGDTLNVTYTASLT